MKAFSTWWISYITENTLMLISFMSTRLWHAFQSFLSVNVEFYSFFEQLQSPLYFFFIGLLYRFPWDSRLYFSQFSLLLSQYGLGENVDKMGTWEDAMKCSLSRNKQAFLISTKLQVGLTFDSANCKSSKLPVSPTSTESCWWLRRLILVCKFIPSSYEWE